MSPSYQSANAQLVILHRHLQLMRESWPVQELTNVLEEKHKASNFNECLDEQHLQPQEKQTQYQDPVSA